MDLALTMWKPPDALRQRWIDRNFDLEFVAMPALVSGKVERAGLPTHNGRIDFRAFDTPPGGPLTRAGLAARLRLAWSRSPTNWRTLHGIRLDRIDFTHARLSNLFFEGVEVTDCLFDRAVIESATFGNSTFRHCSFTRADLGGTRLGDFRNPDRVMPSKFEDCSFASATLTSAEAIASTFIRCDFSRAHMQYCKWTGAEFVDCTFAGEIAEAEFRATDSFVPVPPRHGMLDGVDLSNTSLRWVEFFGQNLKDTRFPANADHLVVGNYECFLHALQDELADSDTQGAGFARAVIPKLLSRLGPEQKVGVFNLRDWIGSRNEQGQLEMRRAFDIAGSRCADADKASHLI